VSVLTDASLVVIAAGMLISASTLVHLWLASRKVDLKVDRVTRLTSAVVLAAFIVGAASASMILVEQPVATATPLWAQEPPRPPQLSDEEREALDRKNAGQSMMEAQKKAAKSAEEKQKTAEKFGGQRNQQKRDNNRRGGGRRR
jgi:predicted PurR-regulated permease PerM